MSKVNSTLSPGSPMFLLTVTLTLLLVLPFIFSAPAPTDSSDNTSAEPKKKKEWTYLTDKHWWQPADGKDETVTYVSGGLLGDDAIQVFLYNLCLTFVELAKGLHEALKTEEYDAWQKRKAEEERIKNAEDRKAEVLITK